MHHYADQTEGKSADSTIWRSIPAITVLLLEHRPQLGDLAEIHTPPLLVLGHHDVGLT